VLLSLRSPPRSLNSPGRLIGNHLIGNHFQAFSPSQLRKNPAALISSLSLLSPNPLRSPEELRHSQKQSINFEAIVDSIAVGKENNIVYDIAGIAIGHDRDHYNSAGSGNGVDVNYAEGDVDEDDGSTDNEKALDLKIRCRNRDSDDRSSLQRCREAGKSSFEGVPRYRKEEECYGTSVADQAPPKHSQGLMKNELLFHYKKYLKAAEDEFIEEFGLSVFNRLLKK